MDEEANLCGICKKPKKSKASASITQWISTCVCDLASQEDLDRTDHEVCEHCGKRIGEARKGSLTQFIFRPEFCSCKKPKTRIKAEFDFYRAPSSQTDDDDRFSEELVVEIDRAKFPVDRYKPFRLLGEGSGGSVYLCRDLLLSKNVAVKTLLTMQDSQLLAFQEEARATSRLNHPAIIQILDFGVTDGQVPYMVLEYFSGQSLSELLKSRGQLDWRLAFAIGSEICVALAYSNSFQVFHGDIKPANILIKLEEDGIPIVKLIDFGVASFTGEGSSGTGYSEDYAGTPAYMCPDQLRGLAYGPRSEIYTLGCVLFELITGAPPYKGDSAIEVINGHLSAQIPEAIDYCDVPEAVSMVVYKSMCKEQEDRFQSFDQFRSALEIGALEFESEDGSPPYSELSQEARSTVSLTIVLGAIAFSLLGVFGAISYLNLSRYENLKGEKVLETGPVNRDAPLSSLFDVKSGVNQVRVIAKPDTKDSDLQMLKREFADSTIPISLSLAELNMTGEGLKYLADLPVVNLNATLCKIKHRYMHCFNSIKTLENLYIEDCEFTDKFICVLDPNSSVNSIDISYNPVTDLSLEHLANFKKLKKLDLRYTSITDSGLSALSASTTLEKIFFCSNPNLSAEGLARISSLPRLRILNIEDCARMDGAALKVVSKMPCLENLQIGGHSKYKPEDILWLKQSSSLKSLMVAKVKSISQFIPYIAQLNNITSLAIVATDIKDGDLNLLATMKGLRQLELKEAHLLTLTAVNKLRMQLKGRAVLKTEIIQNLPSSTEVEELIRR